MIGNLPDHDVYKDGLLLFSREESPASENLTDRERSILEVAYMLWVVVECVDWAHWTNQTEDWKASAIEARDKYNSILEIYPGERVLVDGLSKNEQALLDAAEFHWSVVANTSNGDWAKQSKDWQEAAAKWRDNYFHLCRQLKEEPVPCH